MTKEDKAYCIERGLITGSICALIFALPTLVCGGKIILVSIVGVPFGFLVGGAFGFIVEAIRLRRSRR